MTLTTFGTSFHDKDHVLIWSSWAVFLGWLNVISLIGELPLVGQYIFLLSSIMTHLVRFIAIFFPILIAFCFKFHLSLHQQGTFTDFHAITKIFDMMNGDLTYEATFFNTSRNEVTVKSDSTFETIRDIEGNITFILFLFLVNILLSNVLTALSVNVTEEFYLRANEVRLTSILDQMGNVETWAKSTVMRTFTKIYPR